MATYKGTTGALYLGGYMDSGAVTANSWSAGETGSGGAAVISMLATHMAVVMVGDTFTVAGETGSPTHTVTSPGYDAILLFQASALATNGVAVAFTPAIATGGVASSAVVTFTSPSIAQVVSFEATEALTVFDVSGVGDKWRRQAGGAAIWSARVRAILDYGDAKQAALIGRLYAATPTRTAVGFTLKVNTGKVLVGFAVLQAGRIATARGDLVTADLDLAGDTGTSYGGSSFGLMTGDSSLEPYSQFTKLWV